MRITIFIATAFLLCTSCSNIPIKGDGETDSTNGAKISFDTDILDTDKIIQNLVFAFTQIDNLHPYKTTLQMKAPTGELSKLVHTRFEDAGYGIQFVESDQGLNYVKHSAQSSVSDDGDRTTYRISVGDVSVERDYMLSGEYTAPESVLRVSGSVEQDIDLNDDVFGEELADTQYSEVYFNEAYEPVIITVADRNIAFEKLPLGVEEPAGAVTGRNSFATSVMKNVRTNLQSNFSSIFAEYEDVQQTVLEFPNDSLRLEVRIKPSFRSTPTDYNLTQMCCRW